jgi:hypothetical protein
LSKVERPFCPLAIAQHSPLLLHYAAEGGLHLSGALFGLCFAGTDSKPSLSSRIVGLSTPPLASRSMGSEDIGILSKVERLFCPYLNSHNVAGTRRASAIA